MTTDERIQEIWIITYETESQNVGDWFGGIPSYNPRFFFTEADAREYFEEIKHKDAVKVKHNREVTVLTKEELDW